MRLVMLLLLLPLLGCGKKAEPGPYMPPTQTGQQIAYGYNGYSDWPWCRMPRFPWTC